MTLCHTGDSLSCWWLRVLLVTVCHTDDSESYWWLCVMLMTLCHTDDCVILVSLCRADNSVSYWWLCHTDDSVILMTLCHIDHCVILVTLSHTDDSVTDCLCTSPSFSYSFVRFQSPSLHFTQSHRSSLSMSPVSASITRSLFPKPLL